MLKSGQEPSIVALKAALKEYWRGGECTLEESPAYDPASNGGVERAVRSVKELMRTLKSDLESKSQIEFKLSNPSDRNLLGWMAEYTGNLLRRFSVRPDGKSPHEII